MSRERISVRSPITGEGEVMNAWEKFLSGDAVPQDAVRRMVEDSWLRCLGHGVNPVRSAAPLAFDENGLQSLKLRHNYLIEAAHPVMAQAREFLSESGTIMILTDPTGVILLVEGDPNAKYNSQDIQLVPGAQWTEAISGTNAIGTALASGQPVQICAAEHFCEGIKRWTCSASVIRDPYDGQILGAIDISGLSGSHNTHCLALAVAGAGRIEARLAKMEMEKRSRLLDITLAQGKRWGDSGLVIFDHRGKLVRADETAGLFFGSKGLELGSCKDLGIGGLTGDSAPSPLPDWLKTDWLVPIIDQEERLGTVLAIPLSRRWSASTAVSSPQPDDRTNAPFARIIGTSPPLSKVKNKASQLAKLRVPVLLLGPTGVGKEVFARSLHDASPIASGPFVPVNCGSMTRDLLASELFGYVEGAFTGARRGGMPGKFEAADGGTLFLDEVGEMPLELQAHFLRVLDDGEVYRLGENKPRKVRVRIVAATNRDLRAEVSAGKFRIDLLYRLAVTTLNLPSLAEHKEDIPLLARHFIDQTAAAYGVPAKYPTNDVLAALLDYSWPGNVRELRNVIGGMLLLAEGDVLTIDDLPPEITTPVIPNTAEILPSAEPPKLTANLVADNDRKAIITAISAEHGNFTRAAARLGIAKSTLYEKMTRYRIERNSVRYGTGPS
ncbi:MAG: sigma-54-dependent Fis family transcriptional regulator [Acidocella sp.]|nr:sigma-54-dependent Fis family transcriptional regulator [Acidocella sp.]